MISHRLKCIFVHVPKTGGTSVSSIVGDEPKPHQDILQFREDLIRNPGPRGLVERLACRLSASSRAVLAARRFEEYFKFGFVRNPWDRVVSLYHRREGIQMRDKMSFPEFVEWIQLSSDTCIHPRPHKNQLDWFTDESGREIVDFIGRFERIEEDWAAVCAKLGLEIEIPHENSRPGQKRHYTEMYDDRLRDIIAEKFRVDIERFGYKFGE